MQGLQRARDRFLHGLRTLRSAKTRALSGNTETPGSGSDDAGTTGADESDDHRGAWVRCERCDTQRQLRCWLENRCCLAIKKLREIGVGKFEVFRDVAGLFRWRLKSANNRIVAQSESYKRHFDAKRACKAAVEACAGAKMIDLVVLGK